MAVPVIMPKQGQSVESCILTKWHKRKGDAVSVGDLLFSYETDKAGFDEEAGASGTLLEIFFEEGDDVPVFSNVCVIGAPGENIDEFRPKKGGVVSEKTGESVGTAEDEYLSDAAVEQETTDGHTTIISPRAKKLALKIGIDYTGIEGTGPGGRIVESDVVAAAESGRIGTFSSKEMLSGKNAAGSGIGGRITTRDLEKAADEPADYVEVKLSNTRKIIARTMQKSLSDSAQLTVHSSFDATAVVGFRRRVKNGEAPGFEGVTLNDIVLYAVSRAAAKHPHLNAHFTGDALRVYRNCNLGIAVDTDRGLMVPTVRGANNLSLPELSREARRHAESCRGGSPDPDTLSGGTFTVTNLGSLGVEMFTPILNPPQVGILGVNAIVAKVGEEGGVIRTYPSIGLSLTFDHRAVDGAYAARFLLELKHILEQFSADTSGE